MRGDLFNLSHPLNANDCTTNTLLFDLKQAARVVKTINFAYDFRESNALSRH